MSTGDAPVVIVGPFVVAHQGVVDGAINCSLPNASSPWPQGTGPFFLNVSVALNGHQFTTDALRLVSYKDPNYQIMRPNNGPQRGGETIYITVSPLTTEPAAAALLRVRFGNTSSSPVATATPLNVSMLVLTTPPSLPGQVAAPLQIALDGARFTDLFATFTYYGMCLAPSTSPR